MPGPTELWIILIIILVIFGGSKIPEIMKGIGKGLKEFKKAKSGLDETEKEIKKEVKDVTEDKPHSQ